MGVLLPELPPPPCELEIVPSALGVCEDDAEELSWPPPLLAILLEFNCGPLDTEPLSAEEELPVPLLVVPDEVGIGGVAEDVGEPLASA